LTPKWAAGFMPAAQPNAASHVWRLPPAIYVYFLSNSHYNNGMAKNGNTESSANAGMSKMLT